MRRTFKRRTIRRRPIRKTRRVSRRTKIVRKRRSFRKSSSDTYSTWFHLRTESTQAASTFTASSTLLNPASFNEFGTFANLFQKFKVNRLVQKFIPHADVNTIGGSTTAIVQNDLPTIHTYRMYEVQTSVGSVAAMVNNKSYREWTFNKTAIFSGKPWLELVAYTNAAAPVVAGVSPKYSPWIDSADSNTIILYKPYQVAINTTNGGCAYVNDLKIHVTFKGRV